MKKRIPANPITFFLLFSILFSCSQPTDPSVVRLRKYKKSIVEAYHEVGLFCATNHVPGLTIAVSVNNELVWSDGFGFSNVEFKVPAMPDHKFRIGQASELITGLTAAKLYQEGKIDIDKPVSFYLPDMDKKTESYSIRQLAGHTSGIHQETIGAGLGESYPPAKFIDSFIHDNLDFPSGQYYSHTQLGYDLLGFILQKTSNTTFANLVKSTLTDSLKLSSTTPDDPYFIISKKATCYEVDYMARQVKAGHLDLRGKEASAGYLSSVLDLAKMGNAILYPGFLTQKTIDLMTTPCKLGNGQEGIYGFGIITAPDGRNRHFYGINGQVAGGSAALLIYPDDKIVVAIAANTNGETLELPVFDVAAIFRKYLHPQEQQQTPGSEKQVPAEKQ